MKRRVIWMMAPAMVLGLGACGKKEEAKAPEAAAPAVAQAPAEATPPVPAAPAVPKTPALTPEERAAKLGFVKHLPQDTEVVISFHNGTKTAERVMGSKLWTTLVAEFGGGMIPDPAGEDEEMEDEFELPEGEQDATAQAEPATEAAAGETEPMGPAKLFGTEFTVALGKSAGEQTGNLLTANRRMSYFQMRGIAKAFVEAAKSGDFSGLEESIGSAVNEELFKDLLADPESGVALIEKMKMPPLYFAFRASAEDKDSAAQQLASLVENLGMLGETVEPVEIEKAGAKFAGQKISGAKISKMLGDDRSSLDEMLDSAQVDKLLAAVAKKDLVVMSGTLGDYAVLFLGGAAEDMNFASDLGQSLATGDSLAFCDAYASKELAAVVHGRKEMLDTLAATAGGLSDMAEGLRDGIAGTEGIGDTRDLEALLRMVGEREAALRKLAGNEASGVAAFFEDGLKIESFGGADTGALDWKAPNRMADLGNSEDVVLFANMTVDAAYDEKARAYLEALMETAYAAAMKVSELPGEDENLKQFKEMTRMFDTKFRPDLVSMWQTFSSDFGSSLGAESALVVDLKGSVPTVPGIPQPIVDEGKFPRISMLAPVTDRTKLAASWEKMNTTTTGILAKISEMTGQEIPMQKPISSEKNGFTTWFFSMPFFNDDFVPSVTVGDKWFAASTSKNQALDLIGKATTSNGTRTGLYFSMNFKALQVFADETLKMIGKHPDAVPMSKDDLDKATKLIAAMDDLDKLTVHSRREEGKLRSSIHFKTR